MRQTTNYKLQKPDYNNVADIEVINGNFEVIDTELKKKIELDVLSDLLNAKVDKEAGKGLSSNDFTDDKKEKLESLHNTNIIDNLIDGGRDKALSAEQGKILNNQLMDFDLLSNSSEIKKQMTFASNGSILEVLQQTSGNVKVADRETSFLSDGRI